MNEQIACMSAELSLRAMHSKLESAMAASPSQEDSNVQLAWRSLMLAHAEYQSSALGLIIAAGDLLNPSREL